MEDGSKELKLKEVQAALVGLYRHLEQCIRAGEEQADDYLEFLEDVREFLEWMDQKIDYRYSRHANRSVYRGEIYYCELGENIGSEQNDRRPVIILQNDTGNRYAPTTIVAPITNTKPKLPVHVPLSKVQEGLRTTGVIRLEHIRAISKRRLGVFIEKVKPASEGWRHVEAAIKVSLDLRG